MRRRHVFSVAVATLGGLSLVLSGCSTPKDSAPAAETGGEGFPVTIEHAMGTATIDSKPKRIVTLDSSYKDATLLLGGEVLGYTVYDPKADVFPVYLGSVPEENKDAENLGQLGEPSLEKIIALEPDLIVSAKVRDEKNYKELTKIAPTVFSETTGPTWKENILLLGKAMGEEQRAKDEIAAFEARAKKVGSAVLAEHPDASYSMVRFAGEDTARLYSSNSFIGEIMAATGIPRPKGQPDTEAEIFTPLSLEQLEQADAQKIFVNETANELPAAASQAKEFESSPLWKSLTGAVVKVDEDVWISSVSIQGANATLDDIAKEWGVDDFR
ncbi:iron-siderophore ABC transporter substrate-binding protein [Saxibacter everestensis]|uniref:Iron-siderophore ABC transporter substrate-binding protein n=1 Tax=Saxibacter everestensis TaxID=2909229 RepID=A0ABY8QYG0_9MICO|nr:iron-siderophore ABC transporter substrate-binding protein [Brevibacteriaceae bacterium ZFBP1038]